MPWSLVISPLRREARAPGWRGWRRGVPPRPARRSLRRQLAGAALAAAAFSFAAHCHRPAAFQDRPLRIALNSGPFTLDPHASELPSLSVLRNIYDSLTAFDAGNRVGPALAESWENPDEITWIFHLRRAVSFHDGREFTARDVLFSFDRARRVPGSKIGTYLVAIDKVLALDPHTVEITTRRPDPILLNKVAFVMIVPAGSPPRILQPVGTGPYRLAAHQLEKRLVLRAFERYWGGVPSVRTVEFLPLPDHDARVNGLLDGDLDIIEEPSLAAAEHIRAARGYRIARQTQSLGVTYLLLRSDRPPLDDPRTRRAISLALDRAALVRQALDGDAVPLGQMVTYNVFGFSPDIRPPAAAPAAARALLAAAGHAGGLDLELQISPGLRPELDALAQQLLAVGIRVRALERPLETFSPDADSSFASWFCLSGDASDFFDVMAHSPTPGSGYGAGNFTHYQNRALDVLIEQSEATLDLLARRGELERAMQVLISDYVFIPLYSTPILYGTRDTVAWQPRSDELILVNTIQRSNPHD
ncbi:MAG TPA: ABC transporter substrate-binding protein [Thermoanaerobaculia bacterium]|nr:ABC transporter substrate-binding protein [Thermoanaerobaculia bacterium]